MSVYIETTLGDLVIDLFVSRCPRASRNFIELCKMKHYNNCLFHTVEKDFLTQVKTKSPTSYAFHATGGKQQYFEDEIHADAHFDKFGLVATANTAPDKNDSEFFITLTSEKIQRLDGKHTIFGVVAEGQDVLQKINQEYLDEQNQPLINIRILHTHILDSPFDDDPLLTYPPHSPAYCNLEIGDSKSRLEHNEVHKVFDPEGKTIEEVQKEIRRQFAKKQASILKIIGDLPDEDIKPPENILFVCKLNQATQERDLELIFSKYGAIRSCEIVRDWKTGQSLQYAFIEFETVQSSQEAYLKMENALIDERRIHVDFCQSVQKLWPRNRKF